MEKGKKSEKGHLILSYSDNEWNSFGTYKNLKIYKQVK
jgi:hypothetical protein